jgi:hypothetical protein
MSCEGGPPPQITGYKANPKDLETIVALLTLAAIILTPTAATSFTAEELIVTAHECGSPECTLDDRDLRIVLPFCHFLKKLHGKRLALR